MGGVLDDFHPSLSGLFRNLRNAVRGAAEEHRGDDGDVVVFLQRLSDRFRVNIDRVGIDVGEPRLPPAEKSSIGRRDEGDGAGQHRFPWLQAEHLVGQVKTRRGGGQRNGVFGTDKVGYPFLESRDRRPLGQKTAFQSLHHGSDIPFVDIVPAIGDGPPNAANFRLTFFVLLQVGDNLVDRDSPGSKQGLHLL